MVDRSDFTDGGKRATNFFSNASRTPTFWSNQVLSERHQQANRFLRL